MKISEILIILLATSVVALPEMIFKSVKNGLMIYLAAAVAIIVVSIWAHIAKRFFSRRG